MARLTFPDPGSQLAYRTNLNGLGSGVGAELTVYTNEEASILADILDLFDEPILDSTVTVDGTSLIPLFKGPNDVRELFVKGDSGVHRIFARTVDIVDEAAFGGGGGGEVFRYVHDQAIPDNEWTVTHSLGGYPSVTIVDSAGTEVVGSVEYLDSDTIRVTFNSGFAGRAFLS